MDVDRGGGPPTPKFSQLQKMSSKIDCITKKCVDFLTFGLKKCFQIRFFFACGAKSDILKIIFLPCQKSAQFLGAWGAEGGGAKYDLVGG